MGKGGGVLVNADLDVDPTDGGWSGGVWLYVCVLVCLALATTAAVS